MCSDTFFAGQRVLVTGAASGLGLALSNAFRAAGATVLTTDLSGAEATLDVTSDADWAAAVTRVEQTWGGIDILVNNAGVAGGGRIELCDLDAWRWLTEINLFGAVRGTRAFIPMLKAQGSGRIVNVASLAGLVHPAGMGSYNAVKAAVVAFTETTGHELAAYGGQAHVVCPSYFRTNLMDSLRGEDEAVGAVLRKMVDESPTTAEDVAAEVLAGIGRGDAVILPDDAARAAYHLKTTDPAGYQALMRAQAVKLDAASAASAASATRSGAGEGSPA